MLSFWEKDADLLRCDYLIIGMGFVGLHLSIELKTKHPKARVVVVDRHAWGGGASLKNAGFACFANASELLNDLQTQTEEDVLNSIRLRHTGLERLKERLNPASFDFQLSGSKEVFFSDQKEELSKTLDQLQYLNSLCQEATGIQRTFTFSYALGQKNAGSISNPYEGVLHSGKLHAQLKKMAQELGVELFGGLEFSHYDSKEEATAYFRGNIKLNARHLFLCTNGFPIPSLEEDLFPARGTVLVTEEIPSLEEEGCYFNEGGFYYWRNVGKRLLLGGGRNLDLEAEKTTETAPNPTVVAGLKDFLAQRLGHEHASVEHLWTGVMGMGQHSKTPLIKSLEPNIHIAIRLGGMGVATSAAVAEKASNLLS